MFGGLTLSVFVTRKDYTFLAPVLSVGTMIAFGMIICAIIFAVALVYYVGYLRPRSATNWRMLTAVEEIPEEPPEVELSKEIV